MRTFDRGTAQKVDISKASKSIITLVEKLNTQMNYNDPPPSESIMKFENICNHNDGYLCEHRLQWIVNFLIENMKEK